MPRARSPNSIKAEEMYISSKGKIELIEIAKQLDVSPGTVRSWKNRYKWDDKLNGNINATLQKEKKKKRNVAKDNKQSKSTKSKLNRSGNPNPENQFTKRNKEAEKHGFFSKYLPEETLEIIQEIEQKNPLDILWENINIQYAAIIRAQRIMLVESKEEMIKELKKSKVKNKDRRTEKTSTNESEEEYEYEFQFAWDRQATFLKAQSRAMAELRSMIKQYDEFINRGLATEEQKLRIEKLRVEIDKVKQGEGNKEIRVTIVDDIEGEADED